MRLKIKGEKIKYRLTYYKIEDEFNVFLPIYRTHSNGAIFKKGKWENCSLRVNEFKGKTFIEISAWESNQVGLSNIGEIDNHLVHKKLEVNKFSRFLMKIYESYYYKKVSLLKFRDRISLIKKNILYISLAFLGAFIYFLINHFYDNYLQDLINHNNFIQSIIVFLSLSSIINIFHPFTLRKELSIKDVNALAEKRSSSAIEKHEKEKKFRARFNI